MCFFTYALRLFFSRISVSPNMPIFKKKDPRALTDYLHGEQVSAFILGRTQLIIGLLKHRFGTLGHI